MSLYVCADSVSSADLYGRESNVLSYIYKLPEAIRAPKGKTLYVRLKHLRIINPDQDFSAKLNQVRSSKKFIVRVYVAEINRVCSELSDTNLLTSVPLIKAGKLLRILDDYPCQFDIVPVPISSDYLTQFTISILGENNESLGGLDANGWVSVEMEVFAAESAVSGFPLSCSFELSSQEIIKEGIIKVPLPRPLEFYTPWEMAISSISTSKSMHLPYAKSSITIEGAVNNGPLEPLNFIKKEFKIDPSSFNDMDEMLSGINTMLREYQGNIYTKLIHLRKIGSNNSKIGIFREHVNDKAYFVVHVSVSPHLSKILGFNIPVRSREMPHLSSIAADSNYLPFSFASITGDILQLECDAISCSVYGTGKKNTLCTMLTELLDGPSVYNMPSPLLFIPISRTSISEMNFSFSVLNPRKSSHLYLPILDKLGDASSPAKITLNFWLRPRHK